MKVFAQFDGGACYAPSDIEEFKSIAAVKRAYGPALLREDRSFPLVSDDAEVLLYHVDPLEVGNEDAYPFGILKRGPRGGLVIDVC